MHARPFRFLGIMEPIIERGIVEDIPASLAAIRRVAEGRRRPPAERGRAAVARAERTFDQFEELRAELASMYGDRRQLPSRRELVKAGRCGAVALDWSRRGGLLVRVACASLRSMGWFGPSWSLCSLWACGSPENVARTAT